MVRYELQVCLGVLKILELYPSAYKVRGGHLCPSANSDGALEREGGGERPKDGAVLQDVIVAGLKGQGRRSITETFINIISDPRQFRPFVLKMTLYAPEYAAKEKPAVASKH